MNKTSSKFFLFLLNNNVCFKIFIINFTIIIQYTYLFNEFKLVII